MRLLAVLYLVGWPITALAGVADVPHVLVYDSGEFASAGQPAPAQYQEIADAGYERLVYLAYSDHPKHGEANDRLAHAAGLDFIHIPVRFDAPRYADFALFAAALNSEPKPTFVHCQVNYRASAFSFLYRVIYGGIDIAVAKKDLDGVWQPDAIWLDFMRATLARHDVDIECPGCDWAAAHSH